jgi:hypothetical protein
MLALGAVAKLAGGRYGLSERWRSPEARGWRAIHSVRKGDMT